MDSFPVVSNSPLSPDEVISYLRNRWKATYDLQLVVRRKRLYLQVMWAYLEQKSFPMDEQTYRIHISEVLDVINRLGLAQEVRDWILFTPQRPRLGRAVTLPLDADDRLEEFVI